MSCWVGVGVVVECERRSILQFLLRGRKSNPQKSKPFSYYYLTPNFGDKPKSFRRLSLLCSSSSSSSPDDRDRDRDRWSRQLYPIPMPSSSSSPSSSNHKIVAEYSKSNRSTCKKCAAAIAAKSLRLGIKTRDSRGFDLIRWHHPRCFSFSTALLPSPHLIQGFHSLQGSDQEALKTLVETSNQGEDAAEATININSTSTMSGGKRHLSDEDYPVVDPEEKGSKKSKLLTADEAAKLEKIAFSPSDVLDHYKDAILSSHWKAFQTVIFLEQEDSLQGSSKIAAFDFDGCLAKTSVKRVGSDAWSLMYPSIPDKLQKLHNDGYKLVIFTNESNIDRWKNKRQVAVDSKIGRLNNFIKCVKVPVQVFVACGYSDGKVEDRFRKPKAGMWHLMEKHFNSGISVDIDQSFFVGDAAGRKTDHSDADLKFAKAIGLKFYVPEDYFGA